MKERTKMWFFNNKKEEEKKYLSDKEIQLGIARGILDGNFYLGLRSENFGFLNLDIIIKIRDYLYYNKFIFVDVELFAKPWGGLKTMWDNRYFVIPDHPYLNYNFGGTDLYVFRHLVKNNNKSINNKVELYYDLFSENAKNTLRHLRGFDSFEDFELYITEIFDNHNKMVEEKRISAEKLEKFKNKLYGEN